MNQKNLNSLNIFASFQTQTDGVIQADCSSWNTLELTCSVNIQYSLKLFSFNLNFVNVWSPAEPEPEPEPDHACIPTEPLTRSWHPNQVGFPVGPRFQRTCSSTEQLLLRNLNEVSSPPQRFVKHLLTRAVHEEFRDAQKASPLELFMCSSHE